MRRSCLLLSALLAACGSESTPLPPALRLLSTTLPPVGFLQSYETQLQAEGGTPPYSFRLASGSLPEGLDLRGAGAVLGVAGQAGRFMFTVEVRDGQGSTTAGEVSLRVVPAELELVTRNLRSGRQDSPYSERLAARGGVLPYAWSLATGALPVGLTLTPAGDLDGTPRAFGVFELDVRVTDAEQVSKEVTLALMISALNPMIRTAELPKGRVPEPYELRFTLEGGSPPFSWSLAQGPLPSGLALSTDGVLAGVPTEAGSFPILVAVTDGQGHTDMEAYTLRVVDTLSIRTVALPQVIQRRAYQFGLEAAGGEPPYVWALTAGTLPAGIGFDPTGQLAGITTNSGEYPLTVRLTDADNVTKAAMYTLRVADRFTYEVRPTGPAASFPPVCTSTGSTSYVEIPVTDSLMVSDLDVTVDLSFNPGGPGSLRMVLFSPDGAQAPLCANWLTGSFGGCDAQELRATFDDEGQRPDRPLSVFDGTNPQGTWLLMLTVAGPSCGNPGTVNRVALSIGDDRATESFVVVDGYVKNNLIIEPFIHVWHPAFPDVGVGPHELFLSARVYSVGPNGYREAGKGDDVLEPIAMSWSWNGGAPPGVTLEQDGHVWVDSSGAVCPGSCPGTGQGSMVASGGGFTVTLPLRLVPPDFDRRKRRL